MVNEMPSVLSTVRATIITAWVEPRCQSQLWLLSPCHAHPPNLILLGDTLLSAVSPQYAVMSHWTLRLCSRQRTSVVVTEEFAIRALNVLQGGTSPRTPELRWGSRMHVLIEGSLNRLHCCGNETPAANEHRLDCFLGRERAKKTALWSQSAHGVPLLRLHPSSAPPPSVFTLLSLHRAAAISHLLINFLRQQIMMLFSFCLHLLYSYWNNKKWFQLHPWFFHISRVV